MNWDKLKKQPEQLVDMVNELGTRGVGERFDKNKDTVNHWLKKYGYEYNPSNQKWESKAKYEDIKEDVEETEDGYLINGDIELTKEQLEDIYYDYCELNLTQEETAIKNGLIKDDLKEVLKALGIIHDSLPVPDKEILEKDPKEVVEKILMNKKRKIKEMKPAEELRYLRKLADKHLKKDYYVDRVIEELKEELPKLDNLKINHEPIETNENEMLITLADLHYGKKVLSEQLLGNNEYNKKIFTERMNKYRDRIIHRIKTEKPQKIYITNLGDVADDPQSNTYPNQLHNQDVVGEKQILECAKHLTEFILSIYDVHSNIEVIGMKGNHSDDVLNADVLIMGIVKELLSPLGIKVDAEKRDFKVINLLGNNVILNHGDNIRGGKSTRENDILNIIHALNLQGKNTYFITGHKHHEDGEGINYERKQVPSLVGSDTYSQNKLNVNSRPAQMFFFFNEDGMGLREKVYFD